MKVRIALYLFLAMLTACTIFIGMNTPVNARNQAMPLNPPPCDITGSFPSGPLHRGLPYHVMPVSKQVGSALIDVVSVANPGVNFQVSTTEGEGAGELFFALPPGIDPGEYSLSARLIPKNACLEGTISAQTFTVE